MIKKPTIGLFGTCGNSIWRDRFIETYTFSQYTKSVIEYYNPDKGANWVAEDAEIEAHHLATDEIVLFPITGETYGLGSLGEVGFSILSAIRLDSQRFFVVMIDKVLDEKIAKENLALAKESSRMRALIKQHLKKQQLANLFVVDTLEEMLEVSLKLYPIAEQLNELKQYNPHNEKNTNI